MYQGLIRRLRRCFGLILAKVFGPSIHPFLGRLVQTTYGYTITLIQVVVETYLTFTPKSFALLAGIPQRLTAPGYDA